ncbi:MAG: Maf family protein [Pseudomonadales bacterium]
MTGQKPQIVLASTSSYRRQLLEKLDIPFQQLDPGFAETAVEGESPPDKALRLARGKASAAAQQLGLDTEALLIGSDQVAHCEAKIFSKPGGFDPAMEQLLYCSGKWTTFSTAVCLCNEQGEELDSFIDEYHLKFRQLSPAMIKRYLELDQPYDCAGSIKAESHGILLFDETKGLDINTLYGLPLIKLTTSLSRMGALP